MSDIHDLRLQDVILLEPAQEHQPNRLMVRPRPFTVCRPPFAMGRDRRAMFDRRRIVIEADQRANGTVAFWAVNADNGTDNRAFYAIK